MSWLKTELGLNIADIFVLWSFAVAAPLFDLLARNPGFLFGWQCNPTDVVFLTISLGLILPLTFIVVELVSLALTKVALRITHAIVLSSLVGLLFLTWLKRAGFVSTYAVLAMSVVLGLIGTPFYLRIRTIRRSMVFLLPAVILFPLFFLFRPPISSLIFESRHFLFDSLFEVKKPAPIIMVVFDEFPLNSILDEALNINPLRYPNFAAFSKGALWFRNATAVSEGTLNAVPSILDGIYPRPKLHLLPNAADHPRNLFTLLAGNYQFHVQENNTRMCPGSLCGNGDNGLPPGQKISGLSSDLTVLFWHLTLPPGLTAKLPDISQNWNNFSRRERAVESLEAFEKMTNWIDRPEQFKRFVNSISPFHKPTLHFLHTLLPHAPWEFLPSGKKYTVRTEIRGMIEPENTQVDPYLWGNDQWAVIEGHQRHLLQVGLVDNLLGYLLDHLRKNGLYDPALILVTADHGCSFRANDSRRRPTKDNYVDILAVPLFIKLPYQKEGEIDDRNVETVDILPTIADALKFEIPWRVDGQSGLDNAIPRKGIKTFVTESGQRFLADASTLIPLRDAVRRKLEFFGKYPEGLFKVGPYSEVVGRQVSVGSLMEEEMGEVTLDSQPFLSNVELDSQLLLTHLTGQIRRSSGNTSMSPWLAVAINGIIQAVTRSFEVEGEGRFSAVAPESAFREGHNEVRIFGIVSASSGFKLIPFGIRGSQQTYKWGTPITFGNSGSSRLYTAGGWGIPEDKMTWIDGKKASLVLPIVPLDSPLIMKARVMAFLPQGKIDRQRVRIFVNRRLAGEWNLTSPNLHEETLFIPPNSFGDGNRIVITFETPDAISPVSIGFSSDIRELSLALYQIQLIPLTTSQAGKGVN